MFTVTLSNASNDTRTGLDLHAQSILGVKFQGMVSHFDDSTLIATIYTDGTETAVEIDAVMDYELTPLAVLTLTEPGGGAAKSSIIANGLDEVEVHLSGITETDVIVDGLTFHLTDSEPITIRSYQEGDIEIIPVEPGSSVELEVHKSMVARLKDGEVIIGRSLTESLFLEFPSDTWAVFGGSNNDPYDVDDFETYWLPISEELFSLEFEVAEPTKYEIKMQVSVNRINGTPHVGFNFKVNDALSVDHAYGLNFQSLKSHHFSNATVLDEVVLLPGTHTVTPMIRSVGGQIRIDGGWVQNSLRLTPIM